MKRWIHASEDIEEDIDEWTPYQGHIYRISGGYYDSKFSDNPETAIKYWFQIGKKNPMDTAIQCQKKADAIALCKAATPELLTKLNDQYGSPYKIEYLIEEAQKQVDNGQRWFHEGVYGDSIHPFSWG